MTDWKPNFRLDRMREHGSVHPPEMLLCAGGKSIPTAWQEERPTEFNRFIAGVEKDGLEVVYKTRCYEQDGYSFDADGRLIEETMDIQARLRAKRQEDERRAALAARKTHDDYMRSLGYDASQFVGFEMPGAVKPVTATDVGSNPNDGAVPEGSPQIPNTFDVVAWARGEGPNVPWFAVAKAIREKYGFSPRDKAHALEWLAENRIVSLA